MLDPDRDDSPTAFKLARREILVGALFVGGLSALATLPTTSAAAAWSDESAAQFLEISSLLIPHRLNAAIGKRIGNLMSALNPSLAEHVTGLLAIARAKNARVVEDFFPDVPEGPLRQTALAGRLPSPASGINRRIPLPRPSAVSNLKIASIALVPALVTRRGAVRSGSILKPAGAVRPASAFSSVKMASAPLTVCRFQLSASTSRQ